MMETGQKIRTGSNTRNFYGSVPVGGFLHYNPNISGTPALNQDFVQCNGQTITDTQSPLFGQSVPNLNGNGQFLRAGATGGATGGAVTSSISASINFSSTSISYTTGASTAQFVTSGSLSIGGNPFSIIPPYYTGVAIMRIK